MRSNKGKRFNYEEECLRNGVENKMYINYVGVVNSIYNKYSQKYEYKYMHIANAVEAFNNHFIKSGRHPIHTKLELKNLVWDEKYKLGIKMFGLYYAALFTLYLEEIN